MSMTWAIDNAERDMRLLLKYARILSKAMGDLKDLPYKTIMTVDGELDFILKDESACLLIRIKGYDGEYDYSFKWFDNSDWKKGYCIPMDEWNIEDEVLEWMRNFKRKVA